MREATAKAIDWLGVSLEDFGVRLRYVATMVSLGRGLRDAWARTATGTEANWEDDIPF